MQTVQTQETQETSSISISEAKRIAKLVKCASKDETRHQLTHVKVDAVNGFAESADGYTLARIALNKETCKALGSKLAYWPTSLCSAILKTKAKGIAADCMIRLEVSDSEAVLVDHSDSTRLSFKLKTNFSYPDTSFLFKSTESKVSEHLEVILNPELLVQVFEALKDEPKKTMLKLCFQAKTIESKDAPTVIALENGAAIKVMTSADSIGLVMPGRSL